MVLPYAPEAQWWKLLKHFRVVAHIGRHLHLPHLEANTLATWRPLAARRDTLIVAFPRSAGPKTLPVTVDWVERAPEEPGYELCPPTPEFYLRDGEPWPGVSRLFTYTLPRGAFVYSLPSKPGTFGTLYILVEDFKPTTEEEAYGPIAAELLRDGRPKARSADGRPGVLVDSKGSYHKSGGPHQPLGTELFVVTHLVERAEVPSSSARNWDRVTDYFYFNMEGAEREIRSYLSRLEDRVDTLQAGPAPYSESESSGPISGTELTQSGLASIDGRGELHMDLVASDAGSTTRPSSRPEPPDPSTLPYCNCPRRCFNRVWPQDRSPLCDFCYPGCDDCDCAGEALGPQGQPCCVRPLEAAPACGECTGEVTQVTRTLGQMAVATPAGFAPRCSAPGCEASSQLLADQGSYAPFCTGLVHPPSPRPKCKLPGCSRFCHPTESYDGWFAFCGRSHGRLFEQRRAALEAEAAALTGTPGAVLARVVSGAGTTQISRSDGILCRGCNRSIRMGTPMEVCDEGFVHPEEECRARARARRGQPSGGRHSVTPTATAMATDLQKQARVSAQLSDRRMSTVRGCLDGRCSLQGDATAAKMVCRGGCGRTLHQRCADISKGYLLKGALTCVECRLRAMGAEGQPAESLLNEVAQLMIIELTEGREATSATHSAFVTLAEKWVAEKVAQGVRRIASPAENRESFKNFAKWMVITAERERSFTTTMRAAGGYFERAKKTNFTKDPEVKALIRELEDKIGSTAQPRTHGTRRMLVEALRYVATTHENRPYLRARETVSMINESVGCLRAVESCAAVEKHGLAANDCFILQDIHTGVVSVELKVHDSKTHFSRYINMAAETTTSKVQVAEAFMELFRVNNLTLVNQTEGGFKVLSPDSWSVRLSLLGLSEGFDKQLERALREYAGYDPMAPALLKRLLKYAQQAWRATTGGEDHKYVLLNEGPFKWEGHSYLVQCLRRHGLGRPGQDITVVPAPLLRSTEHGGRLLTPMPQTYSGAHENMTKAFKAAFEKANPPGDPDPELDRQGHEKVLWGQHSWRRLGEKVARDSKPIWEAEGVTSTDVDKYSDWNQMELSKDMQIHYSGEQRSFRVRRCAITRSM